MGTGILLNLKEFNSLFLNLIKFKDDYLEPKEGTKTKQNENITQNEINPKYIELKNKSEKNKKLILLALKKIRTPDNLKLYQDLLYKVDFAVTTTTIKGEGFFAKNKTIEEKKEKVKYFHVSQLLFNEKSKQLFSLEQKKFYYHIKELKEKDFKNINPKELMIKNNIIKCKNFISSILYKKRGKK